MIEKDLRLVGWWIVFALLGFLVFTVLLILRLCAVIDCSWVWITCPLWIIPLLILITFAISYLYYRRKLK